MQRGEVRDPIMVAILGMVTCGFYNIYWMYMVCEEMNNGLGREEFNFVKEILLSMVTCGAWGLYFWWRLANATVEVQQKWGVQPTQDATIIFILALVFYPAAPFLMQQGLNNAWESGTPGGAGGYGGEGF